ncbi:hypothetical protein [Methylobacter psychrophilus]|uniref:hypothetical protein n=1 Tax=Methylobacter psychrophilus TaxID=96941 RepID=UPI0021D4C3AF|nr:hypothetical protein [Methylobacter psychrophilus]
MTASLPSDDTTIRDIILIVTAGRSDLKMLFEGMIYEPVGRDIHQLLYDNLDNIEFFSAKDNEKNERRPQLFADTERLKTLLDLQSDSIKISLPKLEMPLERISLDKQRVALAIILQTCRDPLKAPSSLIDMVKKEPIAAGPLMAHWLAEQCNLTLDHKQQVAVQTSLWMDFLRDGEDQCEPGTGDQINLRAIQRIDDVLNKAKSLLIQTGIKQPSVVLIDSGGLPRFKDPLVAITRYHFPGKTLVIHESETQQPDTMDAAQISVQVSCQSRFIARQMLLKGDIVGAATAVQHLASDPRELDWLNPLRQASQFIRGEPVQGNPFPELAALRDLNYLSILPALRTESSIASGRVTEAITHVFTFFEALLKDGIEKWLIDGSIDDEPPGEIKIDLPRSIISILETQPLGRGKPAYNKQEVYGRFRFNLEAASETWCQAIDTIVGGGGWVHINRILFPSGNFSEQRRLRNLHTHSCLSEDDVVKARQLFHDRNVWRDPDLTHQSLRTGQCFLATPHVAGALTKLTGQKVQFLYQDLIGALIRYMNDHRYATLSYSEETTIQEDIS